VPRAWAVVCVRVRACAVVRVRVRQCQVSTGEAARFVVEDDVARVEMAIHEPLRLEERQALVVHQSIMVSSRVCAAVPHNREGRHLENLSTKKRYRLRVERVAHTRILPAVSAPWRRLCDVIHMHVRVACVCVRACVRARACVRVRWYVCACVRVRVSAQQSNREREREWCVRDR
jgi:hypothetical protein